jgi:hypothetical protein
LRKSHWRDGSPQKEEEEEQQQEEEEEEEEEEERTTQSCRSVTVIVCRRDWGYEG